MKKEIEILMEDNCTRKEAEKYLKTGTVIYDSFEEFRQSEIEAGTPEDELTTIEELREKSLSGLSAVTYEDHEYIITYCL